jgi:hypothetical protein
MHYTEGGVAIANLTIAVNEFYTAKSGGEGQKDALVQGGGTNPADDEIPF